MKSITNSSGKTTHYDDNGNVIGTSWQNRSGSRIVHYDAQGNETGRTYQSPSGHMTHYDKQGNKTGHSMRHPSGQIKHYDTHYNRTGRSDPNFWGQHVTRKETASAGCAAMLLGVLSGLVSLLFLFF